DWDVRSAAAEALGQAGERMPIDALLQALTAENSDVRWATVEACLKKGKILSLEVVSLLLGDENEAVRDVALKMVIKAYPEIVPLVITEATSIVQKQPPGEIFRPLAQTLVADIIGAMKLALPMAFDILQPMLSSPSWQVRVHAIQALGNIRRSMPSPLVVRLLELRRDPDPRMRVVREAADETLAEILSLEAGIEDE
ncbi:MAG: HEAT repeat domain-containing protein, partial [Chloroflexota bacterium]|nr:HEAT repeat domain-containing protein [Chloroflexota bacterium]